MGAEETGWKGSGGAQSFVSDVKESVTVSLHDTVGREEVRGHGAIQVREVWEDVFHSGELLRGAHEGVQVSR